MGKNLKKNYPFRTDDNIIQKLDVIAREESRTRNQQIEHILKNYINNYESKNGTINIKNINMIDNKGTINM